MTYNSDKKNTLKLQHRLMTQERADYLNRGGATLTTFKRNEKESGRSETEKGVIKELLKKEFDMNLDISRGDGQSRYDPIHVLSPTNKDAFITELLVLRGLGKYGNVLWRTVGADLVSGTKIIQHRIKRKEIKKDEIITWDVNYYFYRENIKVNLSQNNKYVVFDDKKLAVEFPYEISWLHFDGVTDYSSQGAGELGYSLAYNAPGIKATIYVYPQVVTDKQGDILGLELEAAKAEIKGVYGDDEVSHEWDARRDGDDNIYYYYMPKHAPEDTSLISITKKHGFFVKVRCSFIDTHLMREINNDFNISFMSLIRGKAT